MSIEDVISSFKNGNLQNKATTYVMPMLGVHQSEFRGEVFPVSQFRACFIGDLDYPAFQDHILLLYKYSGKQPYILFEEKLKNHPEFYTMYEPDNYHTIYVFTIPEKYKDQYELYKKWKPSQFSEKYKQHVLNFYGLTTNKNHPLYQTLYKSEDRFKYLESQYDISIPRDLECSSAPYWEIEVYRPEFKVVRLKDINKLKEVQNEQ